MHPSRVILPRMTLSELARLLGEHDAEEVACEQGENTLQASKRGDPRGCTTDS